MARGSPQTKSQEFLGVSRECPGTTPTTPRGGGPAEGCRSICMDEAIAQASAAERVDQMVIKIKLRTISVPGYLPVNRNPKGLYP